MTKYPILNGRRVEQCTCDKCKRVIYITDSVNQRIKFARSYRRGKEDYYQINKERANVYDVWSKKNEHIYEHIYSLCHKCLMNIQKEQGLRDLDIIDNLVHCFYTEINKDRIMYGKVIKGDEIR